MNSEDNAYRRSECKSQNQSETTAFPHKKLQILIQKFPSYNGNESMLAVGIFHDDIFYNSFQDRHNGEGIRKKLC